MDEAIVIKHEINKNFSGHPKMMIPSILFLLQPTLQRAFESVTMETANCTKFSAISMTSMGPSYENALSNLSYYFTNPKFFKLDMEALLKITGREIIDPLKKTVEELILFTGPARPDGIGLPMTFLDEIYSSQTFDCSNTDHPLCAMLRVSNAIASQLGSLGLPNPFVSPCGLNLLTFLYNQAVMAFFNNFGTDRDLVKSHNIVLEALKLSNIQFNRILGAIEERRGDAGSIQKWGVTNSEVVKKEIEIFKNLFCRFHSASYDMLSLIEIKLGENKPSEQTIHNVSGVLNGHNMLVSFYKMFIFTMKGLNAIEDQRDVSYTRFLTMRAEFIRELIYHLSSQVAGASKLLNWQKVEFSGSMCTVGVAASDNLTLQYFIFITAIFAFLFLIKLVLKKWKTLRRPFLRYSNLVVPKK